MRLKVKQDSTRPLTTKVYQRNGKKGKKGIYLGVLG